jgi:hypothetical protein
MHYNWIRQRQIIQEELVSLNNFPNTEAVALSQFPNGEICYGGYSINKWDSVNFENTIKYCSQLK